MPGPASVLAFSRHAIEEESYGIPRKQGLYNPKYERDACGIGFVVNIKGEKSNQIVQMALESLVCLDHRGARGAKPTRATARAC